jgi:hypothetical protein
VASENADLPLVAARFTQAAQTIDELVALLESATWVAKLNHDTIRNRETVMNFRAKAEMFVVYPKNTMPVFQDLTMPKRDWSCFDTPPDDVRKANVAKWKADHGRR